VSPCPRAEGRVTTPNQVGVLFRFPYLPLTFTCIQQVGGHYPDSCSLSTINARPVPVPASFANPGWCYRRRPGLPSLAGAGSGQQALMAQYNPECQPPFLDVASKWTAVGSYPDPSVIEGMSWQQITSVLRRAARTDCAPNN